MAEPGDIVYDNETGENIVVKEVDKDGNITAYSRENQDGGRPRKRAPHEYEED